MATYAEQVQEMLKQDAALRAGKGEVYLVVVGEYEDKRNLGAFEGKADAKICRDKFNETVRDDYGVGERARLDVIDYTPRQR